MIADKKSYFRLSEDDLRNDAISKLEDLEITEHGLPRYPVDGLEISKPQTKKVIKFIKELQDYMVELEHCIVPIIVSNSATLESITTLLVKSLSLSREWEWTVLPKCLKYSILFAMSNVVGVVEEVKLLFEELSFLKKLLDNERDKLEQFNINRVIDDLLKFYAKEMRLYLEKSTQDMELVKSSLEGFNEELSTYSEEYFDLANGKDTSEKRREISEEDEVYFYEQYTFNLARYEGYALRHEEYINVLMRLKSAKEDARYFSFDLLEKLIDNVLGLLTPLFEINSLSEHSHRRIDKRREKMENREKLFYDNLLEDVYPIVNARIINAIPYEYFADSMNSPFPPTHMSVTNDKLQDACYFIRSMSMALPYDERKKWVDRMKVVLNIKNSTYQSKRYFSGSGQASEESRAFVRDLNNVLQENGIEI